MYGQVGTERSGKRLLQEEIVQACRIGLVVMQEKMADGSVEGKDYARQTSRT